MNDPRSVIGIAAGFFFSFFVLFAVVPGLLAVALAFYLGVVEFLEREKRRRQPFSADMFGPPQNTNQTT